MHFEDCSHSMCDVCRESTTAKTSRKQQKSEGDGMATAYAGGSGKTQLTLRDIWVDLEQGLQQVYGRRTMENKRFMELYTCVFVSEDVAQFVRV